MSTITLSANMINIMPLLIIDASNAVKSYKSELQTLKLKLLTIDSSVCNLEDVISSIKASSQTQEDKIEALNTLNKDMEEFVSDVARIDSNAADAINQSKNDFYDKYEYLKPDIEKSWLEEKVDNACEWCKEHWKEIIKVAVVVVLAVASIVLLCTGVGGILASACWGCIFGITGGVLFNGISNLFQGKNFFDGALDAIFYGAIGGSIGGAIGGALVGNLPLVTSLGQAIWRGVWTGTISGVGSSFVTGTIQYFDTYGFKGTFKDYLKYVGSSMLSGAVIGSVVGGVTSGIGFKIGQIRTNNRIVKKLGQATSNKEKGTLFEKMGHEQISNNPKYIDSDTQIKMNLNGGTQKGGTSILMDEVATTKDGMFNFEFKSSNDAGFTNYSNTKGGGQTVAYVNNGFKLSAPAYLTDKGIALTGTNVFPQNMPVTVIRPENFVSNLGVIKDGIQTMFSGMHPGLTAGLNSTLEKEEE